MSKETKHVYQFGPFRLDSIERTLHRGLQAIPLTLKAFDILVVLVRNSGHVLPKDELMNAVWADTAVEESNLSQNIYVLRKALGHDANGKEFIETVPRLGYRFTAPVVEAGDSGLVLERHSSSHIVIEQMEALEGQPPDGGHQDIVEPEPGLQISPRQITAGVVPKRHKWFWALAIIATASVVFAAIALFRFYLAPPVVASIAVLPFVNATGDSSAEYLSDGLAEDVIDDLTQLPSVRVISRTTAFRFKQQQLDPRQIGKNLDVAGVLTGRMAREGDTLVLRAELMSVADGTQIWAKRYRRGPGDLATLHLEVTRDLASKLRWSPAPGEQHHETNPEAYELYLKSRFYFLKRTPASVKQAITYGEQAVEKDPQFADAYAWLAAVYVLSQCVVSNCVESDRSAERSAERFAEKALQLEPNLGLPHGVLAILRIGRYEWAEAESEFQRCNELSPNEGLCHAPYAFGYLVPHRRYEEAIREFSKALNADPFAPFANLNFTLTLFYAGKYDEAVQAAQRGLQINPEFLPLHGALARLYAFKGKYNEAAAEMTKADSTVRFPPGHLDSHTYWGAILRANPESLDAYASLGKKDEALAILEKWYEKPIWLGTWIQSPFLDSLRSEPRYAALMKKMDLPL
jgi:DNA-binding winged helix-turn-helix (wHTH) protein/TolB-like protein/tetratricopeptide (TPR) repeat protein